MPLILIRIPALLSGPTGPSHPQKEIQRTCGRATFLSRATSMSSRFVNVTASACYYFPCPLILIKLSARLSGPTGSSLPQNKIQRTCGRATLFSRATSLRSRFVNVAAGACYYFSVPPDFDKTFGTRDRLSHKKPLRRTCGRATLFSWATSARIRLSTSRFSGDIGTNVVEHVLCY